MITMSNAGTAPMSIKKSPKREERPKYWASGEKCNVANCSCSGYTSSGTPGTCFCGHLARDHG
jgi:hypothetical protein